MSKVSMWVRVPLQPGKRDEAAALLGGVLANVDDEEGTLLYILHDDPNDPDALFFYELYSDAAALKVHSSSDAFKAIGGLLGPLMAGAPTMQMLNPRAGKGF